MITLNETKQGSRMYYHNHISDYDALRNTADETATPRPVDRVLATATSLVFAMMAIAIVFN